jgi:hypothetical protein
MKVLSLAKYERELDSRKAMLGYAGSTYVRPNAGGRRAMAKRNLLRALADLWRASGKRPPFVAKT